MLLTSRLVEEDVVHIHMEHYSATRKDEILPFVTTWMDLKNHASKINQKKTVKNHMISFIFGI